MEKNKDMDNEQGIFFSVDSRLLFQLGEKLVTDRAVALAELVKNSYDADATIAKIRMHNIRSDGGTIVVEDNGTGMTFPTFQKTWMRIATIDKAENPVSAKYGRTKAGEKGIGRFACRRLSRRLELRSVAEVDDGNKQELRATFNWSEFVPGSELEERPVKCFTVPVERDTPTGTALTLEATTESWGSQDIKLLRYELMDLISPLTFKAELEIAPGTHDPGFHVELDCPEFPTEVEPLDSSFFKNSWAKLSGSVNDEGLASYGLQTSSRIKYQIAKSFQRSPKFKYLRRVQMEVYLFSYRSDFFSNSEWKMGQTRKMGDERGGIKVYADNFRVFGYGSKGDDWLSTDHDRARSVITVDKEVTSYIVEGERPGLNLFRTNNLFGRVVFSRDANKMLEITVNRERIISGEAFEELKKFARLGVDFATVIYSNQVAKELKDKEERRRAREEAAARAEEEARRRAEEARQKAEEEANKAEQDKRRTEEEARQAQQEAVALSDKRRRIEEQRRKAEEARRQAEEEASRTGDPQLRQSLATAIQREKELWEAELAAIEEELEAIQRAEAARTRAEHERVYAYGEAQKADEERKKAEEQQRRAEEDELRRRKEKYEREFLLLRVLASTGTLILIFEHELQALIEDMEEMVSNSSALLAKMPDTEKSSFNEVLESFTNRTEMIKELGEFLGVTMGAESRLEKKEWVLYPIVESVFRPFRWYLKGGGISYKNTVPDTLRTPRMYRSELVSVLHNLMSNAVKAVRGQHKREIEVTGFIEDAIVHILFLDSGKGLTRSRWEEVFEPFESDSEPDIRFGAGTGLGLKIVRDIVRSYDGEARFCEPPDGWTTCVEITLPGGE